MSNYPTTILPSFYNDIEFSFRVVSVRKKTINETPDVITELNWEVIGRYENIVARHECDAVFFDLDEQTEFTPFAELTESQVKSWIMDDEDYEFCKSGVANKINSKVKSMQEDLEVTTVLPWS